MLLGVEAAAACAGGSDLYVKAAALSNVVTVDRVTVCASGDNIIIYDIGIVDAQGNFALVAPGVYSTQVFVTPGPVACFRLLLQLARLERSYNKISSDVVVEFFDLGRNVRACPPFCSQYSPFCSID